MITPGEEALLILLVAATVLLFNFSILTTMSAIQQEVLAKSAALRADKATDLMANGIRGAALPENTSLLVDGRHQGPEEGERYFEATRFSYSGGRIVQTRVRAR